MSKRNRLERVAMGRSPMVTASFMPRRMRPGGPVVYYLSAAIKGESGHRYSRRGEVEHWSKRAYAWRRFMKAMALWVKVNKEIEKELREIGRLRCEALPGGRQERENIPVWFLLGCAVQMKLHRTAAFQRLAYLLRSGSILTRVKFNIGLKAGGFNSKNKKGREIPINQDTARKFFTDTEASKIENWYNTDVQKWLRTHRGYSDKEGIFILDPTLIPVPDNPNYQGAALLPLDKEGRYVDVKKLPLAERRKFKYTRAYKLTMLLHYSRQDDYFMFAGGHLGRGDESGLKRGEQLVEHFVSQVGKGVIKLLIMDREFIDGTMISRFKKVHGIDCLVPLKSNMHALIDALGISRLEDVKWVVNREIPNASIRACMLDF